MGGQARSGAPPDQLSGLGGGFVPPTDVVGAGQPNDLGVLLATLGGLLSLSPPLMAADVAMNRGGLSGSTLNALGAGSMQIPLALGKDLFAAVPGLSPGMLSPLDEANMLMRQRAVFGLGEEVAQNLYNMGLVAGLMGSAGMRANPLSGPRRGPQPSPRGPRPGPKFRTPEGAPGGTYRPLSQKQGDAIMKRRFDERQRRKNGGNQ